MVRRLIEESGSVPQHLSKIRTAYHEAGHAVVSRVVGAPLNVATIKPDEKRLGHVSYQSIQHRRRQDVNEHWYVNIMVSMAGRASEEMVLGFLRPDGGDRTDRRHVRKFANILTGFKSDALEIERKLRRCTTYTVENMKHSIKGVAEALLRSETLDQKRVDQIIAKSGELHKARRWIAWYWQARGLTPKRRRKPDAPKRRSSDQLARLPISEEMRLAILY